MASATPIRDERGDVRWQPTLNTGERLYVFIGGAFPSWLTTWFDYQQDETQRVTVRHKLLAIWMAAREEHHRSRRRARFRSATGIPVEI